MGIFSAIADLLFPPRCIFCRRVLTPGGRSACPDCLTRVTALSLTRRGNCFSRCAVAMEYRDQVRDAIGRFKFQDQPGYATELGRILADMILLRFAGEYDLITWVPVSPQRKKQRGYDQAMLLAMAAALELDDVAVETLKKPGDNRAQSSLASPAERATNVRGAYEAVDPELIRDRRVLLIDDIITTGATLDEAARTLLEAGASEVLCAVLAQPVEDTQ